MVSVPEPKTQNVVLNLKTLLLYSKLKLTEKAPPKTQSDFSTCAGWRTETRPAGSTRTWLQNTHEFWAARVEIFKPLEPRWSRTLRPELLLSPKPAKGALQVYDRTKRLLAKSPGQAKDSVSQKGREINFRKLLQKDPQTWPPPLSDCKRPLSKWKRKRWSDSKFTKNL